MRKILTIIILFTAFAAINASAHGGVLKNAGNSIVYLTQDPLSPFTGEQVKFSFKITDKDNKPRTQLPVTLTLVQTFYGDATKDKTIETLDFTTDANGDFSYTRAFFEAEYFDVELTFKTPDDTENSETGFLVQVRELPKQSAAWPRWISIGLGILLGSIILRTFQKK